MKTQFNFTAEELATLTPEKFAELQKQAQLESKSQEEIEKEKDVERFISDAKRQVERAMVIRARRETVFAELEKIAPGVFTTTRTQRTVGLPYNWQERISNYTNEQIARVVEATKFIDELTISFKCKSYAAYDGTLRNREINLEVESGSKVRSYSAFSTDRAYSLKGFVKKLNDTNEEAQILYDREIASKIQYTEFAKELKAKYPKADVVVMRTYVHNQYRRNEGYYRREIEVKFKDGSYVVVTGTSLENMSVVRKLDKAVATYKAIDWMNKFNLDNNGK